MGVIRVKFTEGNPNLYSYNCKYDIEIGGYVVVDTPNAGYRVAQVREICDFNKDASKDVVCVVDDSQYKKDKELAKERKKLEAQLDLRLEKANKLAMYKALAGADPEMKELLSKLELLESK